MYLACMCLCTYSTWACVGYTYTLPDNMGMCTYFTWTCVHTYSTWACEYISHRHLFRISRREKLKKFKVVTSKCILEIAVIMGFQTGSPQLKLGTRDVKTLLQSNDLDSSDK